MCGDAFSFSTLMSAKSSGLKSASANTWRQLTDSDGLGASCAGGARGGEGRGEGGREPNEDRELLLDDKELKPLPGDGTSLREGLGEALADTLGVDGRLGGDAAAFGGDSLGFGDARQSGVKTGMPLARVAILAGLPEGALGGMRTSRSLGDGLGVMISSTLHCGSL